MDISSRRIAMCRWTFGVRGAPHRERSDELPEFGFRGDSDRLKQLIDRSRRHHERGTLLLGDFNAPAGQDAYRHIVWNGEFIDQWHEANPDRFFEPSLLDRANGWEHSKDPTRIDFVFKNTAAVRSASMTCA